MPNNAAAAHGKAFASRRSDPATKREAILATAVQLFLEKSYGRTSLDDVARRLTITKPAIYHYFRNKEQILLECYRLGTAMIAEALDRIAAHCGTGIEKVAAFISSYAIVMTANFGRCVMRLDEGDLSSAARTALVLLSGKGKAWTTFNSPSWSLAVNAERNAPSVIFRGSL